MVADRGMVHRAPLARAYRRRPLAAVSVLSRVTARGWGRGAGGASKWLVEWKWDGIRAQLVKRGGLLHLWSRGEELITHRFPEIIAAASRLPDGTVLDGEVLAFRDERPLPFSALQQRIGRQKQVAQLMRAVPVVFMTYDILERNHGEDIRGLPQHERRARLELLLTDTGVLRPSPVVPATSWEALSALRTESRARGVEGLMLKRLTSASSEFGRKRGDWWKWKIEPFTIDAVLIYAQPGSGRRASLLTDYTFGVWDQGKLVRIAKAYWPLERRDRGHESVDQATRGNAWACASRRTGAGVRAQDSKRLRARHGIAPASRSASRACCDGEPTRRRKKPIRSRPCRSCSIGEVRASSLTSPRVPQRRPDRLEIRVERANGGQDRIGRADEELLRHRLGIIGRLVVLRLVFDAEVDEGNARLVKGIVVRILRPVVFPWGSCRRARGAAPPADARRP